MNMFLLTIVVVSIIVLIALGVLIYMLFNSKSKKAMAMDAPYKKPNDPKKWILPFIIAIVLTLWSFGFSLIFLAIVWIMRLDPKSDLSHRVTDAEKKICERNYNWLRNSSFITIPVFFIAMYMDAPPIVAVSITFIFHIPIIQRLKTENLFVFRHTQQALYLLILRAMTAIVIFWIYYLDEGFWLFVLVNGSLWLFGTNWEIKQVKNNDCWLMRRRNEEIIVEVESPSDSPIDAKTRNTKIKQSLQTFRTGTPDEREKAVLTLSQLGEVEKF